MVIVGLKCMCHSVSLHSTWRHTLCCTNTCKYEQEDVRQWMKLSFECILHLFYVGQKHNAKYFCPGGVCSNAAKYKPLEQYGKALFEKRDTESSNCNKRNTMKERGKHKRQRFQWGNKKEQNPKEDTEQLKDEARGGKERGNRRACPLPFSFCSLFQVCLLLSVKPWEEPSCIMQLHMTERWGLGQTMETDHIIQSCQSLLSESSWCTMHCIVLLLPSYLEKQMVDVVKATLCLDILVVHAVQLQCEEMRRDNSQGWRGRLGRLKQMQIWVKARVSDSLCLAEVKGQDDLQQYAWSWMDKKQGSVFGIVVFLVVYHFPHV